MFQEKEPGLSSQQTMSLPEALKPESRQEGWETGSLVKLPKNLCGDKGKRSCPANGTFGHTGITQVCSGINTF